MKPGSFLINTARESLVDEDALDAALASGHLAGAALDVFRQPGSAGDRSALLRHENVVLTPHIGGATSETLLHGALMVAEEIERFAAHEPLTHVVDLPHMTDDLLLAIDAGTGSCRAVLMSTDGAQVAIGQREYSHPAAPGIPGSQVFDTDSNWRLICECVREAISVAPGGAASIKAVSTTSMREGMVLYDASSHEIWACPNADSRAIEEATELVHSGAAQEIYERSGDWVSITAPARFLWIARHQPDVFGSIAHVGMLGDWILTKLSGEFVTDPSLGSSSGMFELAERDWSDRVLELCGLDRSVFPTPVESGTVIGSVTSKAADETGLRSGTPVVTGGADTQLALLGLGVTDPGRFTIVGGSFWQHTLVLDEPLIDPKGRLRTLCHTVADRWMIEGIGFYCGIVMRWFQRRFLRPRKRRSATSRQGCL